MVKRVDPTLTDKEAKIGHSKFLDIVDLYDVFHHARFIVNFNRETYGIVKNLQIINTLYINMFCYIHTCTTHTDTVLQPKQAAPFHYAAITLIFEQTSWIP